MPNLSLISMHLGRVLLASLFILGGINKVINYQKTFETMLETGFPFVDLLLPLTILLEFGCGLLVAIGLRGSVLSAYVLFAHTLVVNMIFHDFWSFSGEIATTELSLFFKNISVAGGLLFFAGVSRALQSKA